jgi:hypothetical protein
MLDEVWDSSWGDIVDELEGRQKQKGGADLTFGV